MTGEPLCDCEHCQVARQYFAKKIEESAARRDFYAKGVPWPPPQPNAPSTQRLQ